MATFLRGMAHFYFIVPSRKVSQVIFVFNAKSALLLIGEEFRGSKGAEVPKTAFIGLFPALCEKETPVITLTAKSWHNKVALVFPPESRFGRP